MKTTIKSMIFMIFIFLAVNLSPVLGGERFTDNGDGTVTDHKLNLMWSKTDNQGSINWYQAEKWVKFTFPYTISAKFDDWRLPTLEELSSLYLADNNYEGYEADCGQNVKIVPEIELSCGWVWTSENRSITAKLFNFNRGFHYTDRMVKTRGYRVLPVRDLK